MYEVDKYWKTEAGRILYMNDVPPASDASRPLYRYIYDWVATQEIIPII